MRRVLFNDGWTFQKVDQQNRLSALHGGEEATPVTLPHDAMMRERREEGCPAGAQSGFYPGGTYAYEKTFLVPQEWEEQDAALEFEGIYGIARVWINGALAATSRNGYVGLWVDLNPWVRYGEENLIRIDVDNARQPNSRWYTGSGIYRDTWLWVGEGAYVPKDGLRVTTLSLNEEVAVVEVCAKLRNRTGHGMEAECVIEIRREGEDGAVAKECQRVVFRTAGTEMVRARIAVSSPDAWSPEHPALYECRVQVRSGHGASDEASALFGIRMLALDPVRGFQVNGEIVNLRGACIHHDNGIVGAETFPEAEWYRCRRLKEAGFNAIRSAHHPMSEAMLDACDHLGMLVMDELADMWDRGKNANDFSDVFREEAAQWVRHMVAKDYNHPSVVIYSVGNEIQEAGTKQGSWINRFLCGEVYAMDRTRFTTNALNALNCAGRRLKLIMKDVGERFGGSAQGSGSGSGGGSNALNSFMSLMSGEKGDFFARHPLVTEALEECSQSCDIIGLNYLSGRYELERELHPGKTVLGTETYPAEIERLWALVEGCPHVIGDFTWAGYDYIGEAGVGIFHYDGNANFTSIYPERLAYIGDIDLIGNRRPMSYFREIVYGLTERPYIAVGRMERSGQEASRTAWMFKDNIGSWTWDGWEGKTASVDVYSSGDEVELFLNGRSLGRRPAGKDSHFTATYEVSYEPGTLRAVAYREGAAVGERELVTAGKATRLLARRVTERERDVAFVKVWLADEDGNRNLQEASAVALHAEVMGNGFLEGFGTAAPSSEEDYFSDTVMTYEGCAMAAVRWADPKSAEPARVRFWTDDGRETEVEIGRDVNAGR